MPVTEAQATQVAQTRLNQITVEEVKEIATKASQDSSDEMDFVLDQALDNLINRMQEDEFISFCDTLE